MRVLLADDDCGRAEAVERRLREAGVSDLVRLKSGQRLIDAVRQTAPDVIIVDTSRADRDSLESIREVSSQAPSPIVMFVDQEDAAFMEEAIEAGVCSYNLLGSALPDVKPIVQAAVAIFRRYRKVAETLEKAEAKLQERDIIQRAKANLMNGRRLTEPQAHHHLRQAAMNSGKRMVDIAAELLEAAARKGKG